jgi:hypothetical protein
MAMEPVPKSYQLRAARKKVGLTAAAAAAWAKIPLKSWERWEASPGASHASRTPDFPFQLLRCYELLKKYNLLEEFQRRDE